MTTATIREFNENTLVVSSTLGEDLLNEVIKLSREGYTVAKGTVQLSRLKHQVCMEKVTQEEVIPPKTTEVPVQDVVNDSPEVITGEIKMSLEDSTTPEQKTDEKPVFDQELVNSFEKDKEKLEKYGKSLGIDLDKRKSYGNMVKQLQNYVNKQ